MVVAFQICGREQHSPRTQKHQQQQQSAQIKQQWHHCQK